MADPEQIFEDYMNNQLDEQDMAEFLDDGLPGGSVDGFSTDSDDNDSSVNSELSQADNEGNHQNLVQQLEQQFAYLHRPQIRVIENQVGLTFHGCDLGVKRTLTVVSVKVSHGSSCLEMLHDRKKPFHQQCIKFAKTSDYYRAIGADTKSMEFMTPALKELYYGLPKHKVASAAAFLNYARVCEEQSGQLLELSLAGFYRANRLKQLRRRKSARCKMAKDVLGLKVYNSSQKSKNIVFIGNAPTCNWWGRILRGNRRPPVEAMRRVLEPVCILVSIPEYGTSKHCVNCWQPVERQRFGTQKSRKRLCQFLSKKSPVQSRKIHKQKLRIFQKGKLVKKVRTSKKFLANKGLQKDLVFCPKCNVMMNGDEMAAGNHIEIGMSMVSPATHGRFPIEKFTTTFKD